jgi:hypothetical protein
MTIAASLESPDGQRVIDKVAQTFNVNDDKAGKAVRALADELQARIQRSMLNRAGVADVAALVTNPAAGAALSDPSALASPEAVESGNHILDVLIGNKHVSRKIAARTASRSNLDAGTVEKMLPAVASLLIAELQRQSKPALEKVVSSVPSLVSAGGSPLPLPGDTLPPAGIGRRITTGRRPRLHREVQSTLDNHSLSPETTFQALVGNRDPNIRSPTTMIPISGCPTSSGAVVSRCRKATARLRTSSARYSARS